MIISGRYLTLGKSLTGAEKQKLRRSGLHRLMNGVYVNDFSEWSQLPKWTRQEELALAVLELREHAVLSGLTAAIVLGLPVEGAPPTIELRSSGSTRSSKLTASIRSSKEIMGNVLWHTLDNGKFFSTTSYEDIVIDSTLWHGKEQGLVLADYLLRIRKLTPESLFTATEARGRCPGISDARLVGNLATGWSESPRESMVRLRLLEAGFGDFLIQPNVYNRRRQMLGRADFLFPYWGIAIEYDGAGKYLEEFDQTREVAIELDLTRQHRFVTSGVRVIRVSKDNFADGTWLEDFMEAVQTSQPRDSLPDWRYSGGLWVPPLDGSNQAGWQQAS